MLVSVIIPTLNEASSLSPLLSKIMSFPEEKEIIVADGGSSDGTAGVASGFGSPLTLTLTKTPPGRARQMNAGAALAKGDVLWFVHADSIPEPSSLSDISKAVRSGAAGGFFRLHFHDGTGRFLRFIERTSHTRAKKFGLIFGDQGIFLRREVFRELGGYADIELMEDWELSMRLHQLHAQGLIRALDTRIGTSARRYIENGRLRTWLKMNVIKALYLLGVPTGTLRRLYYGK